MRSATRMSLIASLLVGLSVTANADVITDARLRELTGPGLHNPVARQRGNKKTRCARQCTPVRAPCHGNG